jgi:hypothetical protein
MTFSSTQPSLRARVLARFPAQVLAGNGIIITKSGGTYIFDATGEVSNLDHLPDMTPNRILGRDAGVGPPQELNVGGGLGFTGVGGIQLVANQRLRSLTTTMSSLNSGTPIATGTVLDLFVPFSCTLTRVTLLADVAGGMVLDIWKAPYASFPPTIANTITGGNKPVIAGVTKYQDSTLTGWTTAISAGDVLRFHVDGASTMQRLTIALDAVTT